LEGINVSEGKEEDTMALDAAPSENEKPVAAETKVVAPEVDIAADHVDIHQCSVRSLKAQQVTLQQSVVQDLHAGQMDVRLGAMFQSETEKLEVNYGAAGLIKTGDALLKATSAGAVVADDGVNMELSQAKAVLTRGNVLMDRSLAGAVVARKVKAQNSNVIFLLTSKVEGDVNPLFGPRESLIFGIVAGIVGGILVLTGRLFKHTQKPAGKKRSQDEDDE
jgi:hypothetical protein